MGGGGGVNRHGEALKQKSCLCVYGRLGEGRAGGGGAVYYVQRRDSGHEL